MVRDIPTDSGKMRVAENSEPDFDDKPSFMVDSNSLPEIKDWDVGTDYKIEILVTQKSVHDAGDGVVQARFSIQKIKAV